LTIPSSKGQQLKPGFLAYSSTKKPLFGCQRTTHYFKSCEF